MTASADKMDHTAHVKGTVEAAKAVKAVKPPLSVRRERLLDEIALHRGQMRDAAQTLLGPLHKAESVRQQISGARHWLYPAAPVLALFAMRLRLLPRVRVLPSLALRAWTVWRLIKRFR